MIKHTACPKNMFKAVLKAKPYDSEEACISAVLHLSLIHICMLLGAVWMLGESKLRQLVVSNASILSNMCFFVVMLCPVPIMFYIDSVQQGDRKSVV